MSLNQLHTLYDSTDSTLCQVYNPELYLTINSLSAFNNPRFKTVAIAIKAYYDGSGKANDPNAHYLTLGGYIGTPRAWCEFEPRWSKVLERHQCAYLHMSETFSLRGEFSSEKGWTLNKVQALLMDLFNECLSPAGWGKPEGEFYATHCTINLEDYRKALKDRPTLLKTTPEGICVNAVIYTAMRALPESKDKKPIGRDGQIELYFDEGELFRSKIENHWRKHRNDPNHPLSVVASMVSANKRKVIGLQVADFLSWEANRYYTCGNQSISGAIASAYRIFSSPLFYYYFDYKELMNMKLLGI